MSTPVAWRAGIPDASASHAEDAVYRRLFAELYDSLCPRLGQIIHWHAGANSLGMAGLALNQATAYLPDGYFYRSHTLPPSQAQVSAAVREAADLGATWTLYPAVRDADDARALTAAGFTRLPWFVEAEYLVKEGLDADLRAQLGARRHRDLMRLERRADEMFVSTMVRGKQLASGEALAAFDRLHQLNLAKYQHSANHFSAAIVRLLARPPLGSRLCVILRSPRRGGDPVQAMLALVDEEHGTASLLVHGIDHTRVPPGQNLYATSLLAVFRWGLSLGITAFNLGRGAEEVKLRLGANSFHLLANYLGPAATRSAPQPPEPRADSEILGLRRAAESAFEEKCGRLRAAVDRGGAAGCIRTPPAGAAW